MPITERTSTSTPATIIRPFQKISQPQYLHVSFRAARVSTYFKDSRLGIDRVGLRRPTAGDEVFLGKMNKSRPAGVPRLNPLPP